MAGRVRERDRRLPQAWTHDAGSADARTRGLGAANGRDLLDGQPSCLGPEPTRATVFFAHRLVGPAPAAQADRRLPDVGGVRSECSRVGSSNRAVRLGAGEAASPAAYSAPASWTVAGALRAGRVGLVGAGRHLRALASARVAVAYPECGERVGLERHGPPIVGEQALRVDRSSARQAASATWPFSSVARLMITAEEWGDASASWCRPTSSPRTLACLVPLVSALQPELGRRARVEGDVDAAGDLLDLKAQRTPPRPRQACGAGPATRGCASWSAQGGREGDHRRDRYWSRARLSSGLARSVSAGNSSSARASAGEFEPEIGRRLAVRIGQ